MMNLFDSLRVYAEKWQLKNSRSFTDEEKQAISRTEVVESQYGTSVCFFLKKGGQVYIPLSTNSSAALGDSINMDTAKVITLGRSGEDDITRIEC